MQRCVSLVSAEKKDTPARPSTPSKTKKPAQKEQTQGGSGSELVSKYSAVLQPVSEEPKVVRPRTPEVPVKSKKTKSRSNSRQGQVKEVPVKEEPKLGPHQHIVVLDYYSVNHTDFDQQPVAQVTFTDPTTGQLLI